MMPIAMPLFFEVNIDITIASPVANASAPPTPCKRRVMSKILILTARVAIRQARQNIIIPIINIFLRPYISAARPAGIRNIALANRNAVGTQLTNIALALKSNASAGTAIFTADIVRETQKVDKLILKRANQRAEGFLS